MKYKTPGTNTLLYFKENKSTLFIYQINKFFYRTQSCVAFHLRIYCTHSNSMVFMLAVLSIKKLNSTLLNTLTM